MPNMGHITLMNINILNKNKNFREIIYFIISYPLGETGSFIGFEKSDIWRQFVLF